MGEECGEWDHHAHDQLENRGHPLACDQRDAELPIDAGQGGGELQLGEVGEEGGESENSDRDERRVREVAVVVGALAGQSDVSCV